jgi:hypothetical protein
MYFNNLKMIFSFLKLPLYSTSSVEVVFIPDQKAITITHKDFLVQTPFETGTISFHGRVVKSIKTVWIFYFINLISLSFFVPQG